MTIASEITNYANGLGDAYDAVNDMQGIIPTDKNMNNLDTAIRTIPQSFGPTYTAGNGIDITNDVISIDDTVVAELSDIPTKTSDLQNDGSDGTSTYVEADDYATAAAAGVVKTTSSFGVDMSNSGEIKGAVVTSDNYPSMWNDAIVSKGTLENALSTKNYATTSDLPTVNDSTITIQKNGTTVDSFTTNASSNKTINITVPTTAADVSALPASTKYGASLSLTINSSTYVVTGQLKDQDGNNLGTAQTIDLPLESVVVSGSYDSQTKEVVLTLQNGSSIRFSVADLVSGLQPTLTAGSNITIDSNTNTISATDTTYSAGTNIQISAGNVISATDTTYSDFTGATTQQAGAAGLVPAPTTSDPEKYLKGDGTWDTPTDTTYSAGTNVQISAGNVISATDTTYSDFTGATSGAAGANGLVPAPAAGDQGKALKGDGTWGDFSEKFVIMKYGEANAWAKFLAAYQSNAIVYCRASSNANPATGAQTRLAFMAYVSDESNPTNVEFQYVRSVSSKTSSQPVDQVFVYKLTNASGGTWSVQTRDMAPKLAAGTNANVSYSSGTYTISATDTTYSNMTGATSGTAGAAGLVPAPAAGDQDKVLSGAGTWVAQSGGGTTYTAGAHIDITSDVISAEGYIWGDDAAPASTPASTITSAMIVDGTIQATDIATGVVPIITMTDTDPGEGAPLAANNFIAVYGDDPSNMNYSLNEAKTGATWIDGSPIYKKTINFGSLPNATEKTIAHSISNLSLVIKVEGFFYNPNSNVFSPFPQNFNGNPNMFSGCSSTMIVDATNIRVGCTTNMSTQTAYITVYYTKSS